MKYLVCKPFNEKGISKTFQLAKGSVCNSVENVIYYNNLPVCFTTSQNAYDFFSRDDDGNGQERFDLIQNIFAKIREFVDEYNQAYSEAQTPYLDHELSETEQLELNEILGAIKNKSQEFYNAVREAYPSFLKPNSDVFTFDFYNANVVTLHFVADLLEE